MTQFLTSAAYWLPLQHHEPEFNAHAKIMLRGARPDTQDLTEIDSTTDGLVSHWHLLETQDNVKAPRRWVQAAPIVSDGDAWAPVKEDWRDIDSELKGLSDLSPLALKIPGKYPGIAVSGTEIEKQIQMTAPVWAGLVCPSHGGEQKYASAVWDMTKKDIDPAVYAPITSAWMIYRRPQKNTLFGSARSSDYDGIAWQLGLSSTPDDPLASVAGLGMCADFGFGKDVYAAASYNAGGPFDSGNATDQHQVAKERGYGGIPGRAINALHLSTNAIRIRPDGTGDGPEQDSGQYRPCLRGPVEVESYWRFDPEPLHKWKLGGGRGLWRWQSSAFIAAIPDRDRKKKERPLDDGGPPRPLPPANPVPSRPLNPPQIPPDNFGFPRPGGLPPELLGPVYVQSGVLKTVRPLASTVGEIGLRGLVYRESADWKSFSDSGWALDDRNRLAELDEESEQAWADAAAVVRVDVASSPYSNTSTGRYQSVSGGTVWHLPAEMGLEDHIEATNQGQSPQINYATIGKRYLGMAWGVGLAWGKPALSEPWKPGVGFSLEYEPAGTFMRWYANSNTGTQTTLMTMLSGGATSFVSTLSATTITASVSFVSDTYVVTGAAKTLSLEQDSGGSWGTDRAQVYQDADGTIALLEANQEFSGDLTLSGELAHTGGAVGFLGATPSAQGSAIAAPTGGATIDSEARTAINSIRAVLAGFGFIAG